MQTLLRLPPYCCTFNPIELILANLKSELRKCNQSPELSKEVVELVKKVLAADRQELWKKTASNMLLKKKMSM